MKIRIEFTVDVDREVWVDQMTAGDPGAPASEVREDVKVWAESLVRMELRDQGLGR